MPIKSSASNTPPQYRITHYRICKKNGRHYSGQWNQMNVLCNGIKEIQDFKQSIIEKIDDKDDHYKVFVDVKYVNVE